jgi:hypothetical protein
VEFNYSTVALKKFCLVSSTVGLFTKYGVSFNLCWQYKKMHNVCFLYSGSFRDLGRFVTWVIL